MTYNSQSPEYKRRVLKKSRAQEKRVASSLKGGQTNARSGAGDWRKHDVRSDDFLVECKLRMNPDAKSFSLKVSDVRPLVQRAREEGKVPLMQIDLAGHRYVVLPEEDFMDIVGVEGDELQDMG